MLRTDRFSRFYEKANENTIKIANSIKKKIDDGKLKPLQTSKTSIRMLSHDEIINYNCKCFICELKFIKEDRIEYCTVCRHIMHQHCGWFVNNEIICERCYNKQRAENKP